MLKNYSRQVKRFQVLTKKQVSEFPPSTVKENTSFDEPYYSQIDGAVMGSPLTTLTKYFLCHQETKWLKSCPKVFKPVYYKRNVDEVFAFFEKAEQV